MAEAINSSGKSTVDYNKHSDPEAIKKMNERLNSGRTSVGIGRRVIEIVSGWVHRPIGSSQTVGTYYRAGNQELKTPQK